MDAAEARETNRRVLGWVIGIAAGLGPALTHEGFMLDLRGMPTAAVYVVAVAGGVVAGAMTRPDPRLRVFGAVVGGAATPGAAFAIAHFAHAFTSISLGLAILVGFAGAAPALLIGGLFYGMARDRLSRGG